MKNNKLNKHQIPYDNPLAAGAMKETDADYVNVGKVGSTYGIHGWVKIQSFTESITHILDYTPWYLEQGNDWQRIEVTDSRLHGKGIIVKFAGYDDPERSRLLAGKAIAVPRSSLPTLPKGDYYWNDLKGLTVINQHGEILGKVIYLLATGANDVLVVQGKKEHAIPYLLKDVIVNIDLVNKTILVNWDVI
jgi:16S rRNA processing protein RimM